MEKPKHPGGRPPKYNQVELAEKLLIWVGLETSVNLCEFCALNMIDPKYLLELSKNDTEFSESYRIAKMFLGVRREKKLCNGELHQAAYNKNTHVYDAFIFDTDEVLKDLELERKKRLIDYESSKKTDVPPFTDLTEIQNENMELKARIAQLESINNQS